ncbi:MAG: response regulator [Spirochaetia bacterium]|jgi:DNA-binding response OmpR family regulator|nr:response regulator [Spirochaetia bacterium]
MIKIKLVDDDIEITENIMAILGAKGFQAEAFNELSGAVEFIKDGIPDLIILDVMFPENPAGGLDLAREIRTHKELEKIPVILFTNINQELPMEFSQEDIDDEWMPVQSFMEKPIKPEVLINKINEQLK